MPAAAIPDFLVISLIMGAIECSIVMVCFSCISVYCLQDSFSGLVVVSIGTCVYHREQRYVASRISRSR